MSRKSNLPAILLALATMTMVPEVASSQVPLSPRSLGMGGALNAAARGQEAIFLNPALLALPGSPSWSVALAGIAASAELEGAGLDEVVDLFGYEDLSDAERADLLAEIPATGVRGKVDVRAPVAAVQIGPFGLGAAYVTLGDHGVSRDMVELLLNGYEEGRTDYSVDDTRGHRASLWDLAVGYGVASGPVTLGVTGHLLLGGVLVRTFTTEPQIDLVRNEIDVGYRGLRSTGGTGMALDLGAAYQPLPSVTLSAAVTGAYSHLDWSDEVRVRELTLTREDFDNREGLSDFIDRYEESERALQPEDEALLGVSATEFLQAESQLPTRATLGVAWQPVPSTDLVASYSDDLSEGALGGDWTRHLGVGIEHRVWLLALRAGAATDADTERMLTGGLSIGPVNLGIARLSGEGSGSDRVGWVGVFGLSTSVH